MRDAFKAIEMRGVIALVSVLGSIGLAVSNPQYGVAAISILSTCAGGYFGNLQASTSDDSKVDKVNKGAE